MLPIDFHCHIDPQISHDDMRDLEAVVFAATPSLSEARGALGRSDEFAVWGVGCHPGLVRSQRAFNQQLFSHMTDGSAFVSEVGLDGDSRVPLVKQVDVLGAVLEVLRDKNRIVSLHSYRASSEMLAALAVNPLPGMVLHWWLGSVEQTREAVAMGCYFSVNASSVRRREILDVIPSSRILTETDHPAGDRFAGRDARPGNVTAVERALSRHYGVDQREIREQMWRNLDHLVHDTAVGDLLPRGLRLRLSTL